jgi:hypothetical protein
MGLKPVTRRVWAPIGERPIAHGHHRFDWLYVTAFVAPATGETFWYLSNGVSKEFFEALLETFAREADAGVNGGVKLGHWGGAKAGQFGYGSSRCGASGPAEMARVSQPGRTRHSGSADGFAGFGIGRSDFAPAARH